ncbi:MAG: hypothetical protein KAG26_08100 [Methylococcales bacterium]|nr:hypothetical protein [Methylococcales bacterium]
MNRIFAYFFFVLLTIQTFSQLFIVGDFIYNQDYIAANLCENIEKPELECNGKCHLKKELTKDTKEKHEDKIVIADNVLFFDAQNVEIILDEPIFFSEVKTYSHYLEKDVVSYTASVFHPPC